MKKIIAISASPSKGRNSDSMLDSFITGFKEKAEDKILIEKIYLNEIYIEYYSHENNNGPQEEEKELNELFNKFNEADGIVIATPTYNFSVPAKLKNLIDRIKPIVLDEERLNILGQPRGKMSNKRMFFLVSGGTPTLARFFIFFLFPGFWLKTVFAYYGTIRTKSFYSGDIDIHKKPHELKKIEKLGGKFAKKFL